MCRCTIFARAPGLFYSTISHIEAAALKLFEDEDGLGQITKDGREIRFPKVLHHDIVLILEDLGHL
jgi:hypothetical protein